MSGEEAARGGGKTVFGIVRRSFEGGSRSAKKGRRGAKFCTENLLLQYCRKALLNYVASPAAQDRLSK